MTNTHVVENATQHRSRVTTRSRDRGAGRSILKRQGRTVGAQIVAIDHETDIAVVKVDAHGLPPLPFGDSDSLRSGQLVLAFGSPLGLESSVSMGVVSAVARQLTPDDPMIYIQTDATINPGNSGGALVDTSGRLVGVNTLIYSQSGGSEGIGFAAPSNIVRNVFAQIRKQGRVRRGEIGVSSQTITPLMAEALWLTWMQASFSPTCAGRSRGKSRARAWGHRPHTRRKADGERAAVPDQCVHARVWANRSASRFDAASGQSA